MEIENTFLARIYAKDRSYIDKMAEIIGMQTISPPYKGFHLAETFFCTEGHAPQLIKIFEQDQEADSVIVPERRIDLFAAATLKQYGYYPGVAVLAAPPYPFRTPDDETLPSLDDFKAIGRAVVKLGNLPYTCIKNSEFKLMYYLAPFLSVPGFSSYYCSYITGENDKVHIDPPKMWTEDDAEMEVRKYQPDMSIHFTKNEMAFICLMFVMCSSKKFASTDHRDKFLKSRISAFGQALSARECSEDRWNKIVDIGCLYDLCSKVGFFPRARKITQQFLLHAPGQFGEMSRNLLSTTYMTIYHCIFMFVFSEIKYKAHINPSILSQIGLWMKSFKAMVTKYHHHWKFYKLFENENEISIVSSNWPLLASLSYHYCFLMLGMGTMSSLTFRNKNTPIIAYLNLLKSTIKDEYLLADYRAAATQFEDTTLYTDIGIDWEKLKVDLANPETMCILSEENERLINTHLSQISDAPSSKAIASIV